MITPVPIILTRPEPPRCPHCGKELPPPEPLTAGDILWGIALLAVALFVVLNTLGLLYDWTHSSKTLVQLLQEYGAYYVRLAGRIW